MTQNELYALIAVVTLGLVVGVIFVFRWRKAGNKALKQLIRTMSNEALIDVVIPDGAGGEIHLDVLLLTPYGLVLLETKDVEGAIFAGDRMDTWSATHEGQRLTFDNPVPMLQARGDAVRLLAPGVPLESRVLFVGEATFPKGHPDMVATVPELLAQYAEAQEKSLEVDFSEVWSTLRAASRSTA